MSRYHDKANALLVAWRAKYGGQTPTFNAVVLVMAVAEHETGMGDAWEHSGDWGAIQLTFAQQRVVPAQFREDHHDSDPVRGPYVTAFWRFPAGVPCPFAGGFAGDQAGAWMLLEVLLDERPVIKASIDTMSPHALAEEMYRTHYYGGIHDPRRPGGAEANVADYEKAVTLCATNIGLGLADWTDAPDAPTLPPPLSGVPQADAGDATGPAAVDDGDDAA